MYFAGSTGRASRRVRCGVGRKRVPGSGVTGLCRWTKTGSITGERFIKRKMKGRAGLGGHKIETSIWGMFIIGQPRAEAQWTAMHLNLELRRETEAGDSNLGGIGLQTVLEATGLNVANTTPLIC